MRQVENEQTNRCQLYDISIQARKGSLLEIGDFKTLVRQSKFSCRTLVRVELEL